eukprot:SAG22_NODE_487_length_9870_cov_13.118821_16_plen_205_part_00
MSEPAGCVCVLARSCGVKPTTCAVAAALADAGLALLLTDLKPDSPLRDKGQLQREAEFGANTKHQQQQFALPQEAIVDTAEVDVSDRAAVERVVATSSVVVFCAVVREHRQLGFDVNTRGTLNAIRAAVANGHDRFINSGPVDAIVGPGYQSKWRCGSFAVIFLALPAAARCSLLSPSLSLSLRPFHSALPPFPSPFPHSRSCS